MRKLFLSSQGLSKPLVQPFLEFLNTKPAGQKVAHIPTAADPYEEKEWVVNSSRDIENLGFDVEVVDLKTFSAETLQAKLTSFDIIFVNGGNTFYLLDWVRRSSFDKILGSLLDQGKVYFGLSAGSIIVGPTIESSGWDPNYDENIPGLEDLSGIGIVPFAVVPHYQKKNGTLIERQASQVTYPIIALTDDQAVLVEDARFRIVGNGPERVINS